MLRSDGGTEEESETGDDELVGRTIGKYSLTRVIGRGGMGVVYEAQNTAIGKRVAIKLVSAELAKNKDAVRRFQREAQAASAVESAHIVDIFDSGTADDGTPYIVMEMLRGEDLGHRIRRLGRLELDETLHITVQILRGLGRAHAAGIVHRDLKPDNIFLVDRDDDATFVKILDFGISKVAQKGETPVQTLTKQGTVLGTPFYMSPEQAQGFADTDGRADLWSVGAIVYECLTGRAPHNGGSYEQVIVSICTKDADDVRVHNPGVPEAYARVIARALTRDRDARFATAREFLDALSAASGGTLYLGPRSSDEPSTPTGSGHPSGRSSPSGRGPDATTDRMARVSTSAFDETLEMKGGGPSRVGWATNGGTTVRRDRKRFILIAGLAVVLGAGAAIAFALRHPPEAPVRPAEGASGVVPSGVVPSGVVPSSEITVKLRASVPGARFSADGKPLVDGALRGKKGELKRVLVEADGYAPIEALVPIEVDAELPEIVLSPRSAGTATAPQVVEVTPRTSGKAGASKPPGSASGKASAQPAPTTTPVLSATPSSAPTLTIKRD